MAAEASATCGGLAGILQRARRKAAEEAEPGTKAGQQGSPRQYSSFITSGHRWEPGPTGPWNLPQGPNQGLARHTLEADALVVSACGSVQEGLSCTCAHGWSGTNRGAVRGISRVASSFVVEASGRRHGRDSTTWRPGRVSVCEIGLTLIVIIIIIIMIYRDH